MKNIKTKRILGVLMSLVMLVSVFSNVSNGFAKTIPVMTKQNQTSGVRLFEGILPVAKATTDAGVTSGSTLKPATTAKSTTDPAIMQEPSAKPTTDPAITQAPTESPVPTPDGTYAKVKMMFTTDLHGHITTTDYENGGTEKEGTLARVATKLNEERAQVGSENSFLFDIGDVLYDYSTDYIYEYDDTSLQPIYRAMASLNYDAITLGNHEFEYGLPYIVEQLQDSGLTEKCVVSNVTNTNTGKHVWNENKIIERTVTATNGEQFVIKVGIVGETIPILSKKRADYTGVLTTEDMLKNATTEAAALKAAGADFVVCLAHSGIGTDNPEELSENVTYALTKDPNIDAVFGGHLHKNYPSNEKTSPEFYGLPGMDPNTNLANGKNLIMAAEQGKYFGVADMTIQKTDTGVQIVDRASKVVKVGNDVEANADINNNYMGNWRQILIANCSSILGEIAAGANYQNYFGTLEDNSGVQLVNNAKISFGLNYINTEKPEYKDLPVVGVSTYERCGLGDAYDYYDLSGDFLQSYLSSLQKYKTAIYLYKITGTQLKEWMEWGASAYENTSNLQDAVVPADLTKVSQNLLRSDWKNSWYNFYMFDGVEYTIDTTVDPRYDYLGNLVGATNRVKNVTINGVPISDTAEYIVVGDRFTVTTPLAASITAQKVYSSKDRCQNIIKEYVESTSMNGSLKSLYDSNWKLEFAPDKKYIVESGNLSEEESKKKSWLVQKIGEVNQYLYYLADFSKKSTEDTLGPNLVLSSLNTKVVTNKDVTVKVNATDISGISCLKYTKGRYNADSEVWNYSADVTNSCFVCGENGIYSVFAIDGKGNRRVAYIRLTNINKSVLEAPVVDTYTNRKTKITGTAAAGAQIYFEVASGKVYSTKVGADGKFSYKLPVQKAGTTVYAYVIDSKGKTSASTEVIVKRTGPNKPTINTLKSNSVKVTGKLNDTYVTPVLFTEDNKVYIPEGSVETYTNSEVYSSSYTQIEVPTTIKEDGTFIMELPKLLPGGTTVMLNTIDTLYRASLTKNGTVDQKVPNKPSLATKYYTNNAKKVAIYSDEKCTVRVVIDKKIYSSSKATYQNNKKLYKYSVSVPKSSSRKAIKIYASNDKGNSKKVSVTKKEAVPYAPKMEQVKPGKNKTIKGTVHLINEEYKKSTVSDSNTTVYVSLKGKVRKAKLKADGSFVLKVKFLSYGTTVSCWAENVNGKGFKKTFKVR